MSDIEQLDNYRKEFDHRITYLESVCKNVVIQGEYRNDIVSSILIFENITYQVKLEERLMNKTAKAIDGVHEELGNQKDYIDQKTTEFQRSK